MIKVYIVTPATNFRILLLITLQEDLQEKQIYKINSDHETYGLFLKQKKKKNYIMGEMNIVVNDQRSIQ